MTWFKVDDGFSDHPKVKAIPRRQREAACGLWVLAGSWSSAQLTEGRVPAHMIEELGGTKKSADALVMAGLWTRTEDGYAFHDWTQANPTKAEVETGRKAAADRQKRAREKAAERRAAESASRDSHAVTGEAVTRDNGVSHAPPDPTRPDPTKQTPPNASRSAPLAQRLPDDYAPSDNLVAWVRAHCPDVPASEHDRFVDHWRATPGAKGRKLDWDATWRNWMRRAQDDIRSGRRAPAGRRRSTTDDRVAAGLELAARYEAEDGATVHALPIGGTA